MLQRFSLLPVGQKAPQVAMTPFRVYNCAVRKSNGYSVIQPCPFSLDFDT